MKSINLLTLSLVCAERLCIKDSSSEGYKHLSLVRQSRCLDISMDVLRGPFLEQMGNLSMKVFIYFENIFWFEYYADES
jgi:hypothetical protein